MSCHCVKASRSGDFDAGFVAAVFCFFGVLEMVFSIHTLLENYGKLR